MRRMLLYRVLYMQYFAFCCQAREGTEGNLFCTFTPLNMPRPGRLHSLSDREPQDRTLPGLVPVMVQYIVARLGCGRSTRHGGHTVHILLGALGSAFSIQRTGPVGLSELRKNQLSGRVCRGNSDGYAWICPANARARV